MDKKQQLINKIKTLSTSMIKALLIELNNNVDNASMIVQEISMNELLIRLREKDCADFFNYLYENMEY